MSIKVVFWVDLTLFLGFLAAFEPHFTGLSVHEWLTIGGVAILIIHILFHWAWLATATTRFFQSLNGRDRLNYIIIGLVFFGFICLITSGLMISESVLPAFGLNFISNILWRRIHAASTNLTLLLVALHFALHWDWVRNAFLHSIIESFRRN